MSDLTIIDGGQGQVKKGRGRPKGESTGLNKGQKKIMKLHDVAKIIESGDLGVTVEVVDDGKGIRKLILVNDNREVDYVDDEFLINHLIQYAQKFMHANEDYIWLPSDAKAAMRIFKSKKAIEEPKKFAWRDDKALCFKRLPFEHEAKEHYNHPCFDMLLDNIISDKAIFMDFIGSIFINESSNQNYLWAYGLGGDGKGSFFSIIEHLLGSTCTSLNIPTPTDNHWGEFLLGKRVGIFSDVNNLTWTTSGLFKMLTGDDAIPINPKFEKHFSIKPRMKFIFASNFRPSISSLIADKRRLVFCEFKPVPRDEYDNMSEKLIEEAQEIVNHCVHGYLKRYPKYTPLVSKLNTALVEELASHAEEDFTEVLEASFEIKEGWYTLPSQLNNAMKNRHGAIDRSKFVHWLEAKHGIKKQSVRPKQDDKKGTPIIVYKNLKSNNIGILQVYGKEDVVEKIVL